MEPMEKIAAYPPFWLCASHSGYVSMIIYGNGDRWASTSTIIRTCELLTELMLIQKREQGLRRRKRSHECNILWWQCYELEAGYSGTAPRYYSLRKERSAAFGVMIKDARWEPCPFISMTDNLHQVILWKSRQPIRENSYGNWGSIFTGVKQNMWNNPSSGYDHKDRRFAFSGFEQATSINIPASVKEIGTGAFAQCLSLENFECWELK